MILKSLMGTVLKEQHSAPALVVAAVPWNVMEETISHRFYDCNHEISRSAPLSPLFDTKPISVECLCLTPFSLSHLKTPYRECDIILYLYFFPGSFNKLHPYM